MRWVIRFKIRVFDAILIQPCKATFSALRSTVLQVDISRFVHVLFLIFQLPFDCSLYSSVSCSFFLRQFTVTRSVKCSSTCNWITRPASYHKIYSPYHYFSWYFYQFSFLGCCMLFSTSFYSIHEIWLNNKCPLTSPQFFRGSWIFIEAGLLKSFSVWSTDKN